jgi:hypothetical protein
MSGVQYQRLFGALNRIKSHGIEQFLSIEFISFYPIDEKTE